MSFFKGIFGKKAKEIESAADFWEWFDRNQSGFHEIVRSKDVNAIERKFFTQLEPRLKQLRDGVVYLVGMLDDTTAELILTADGNPKNIAFVEELVSVAPHIAGWQFTALKQPMGIGFGLTMNGIKHDKDVLWFYPVNHPDKPDLVDITVVHRDLNESNEQSVKGGAFILLENYLGELSFLENIDDLTIIGPDEADRGLHGIGLATTRTTPTAS